MAEEVFKQTFIPQKMDEVINYQKDARRAQSGESVDYLRFLGLKSDLTVNEQPEMLEEEGEEEEVIKGEEAKTKEVERINAAVEGSKEVDGSKEVPEDSADEDDDDDNDDAEDTDEEKDPENAAKKAVERRDLSPESWKRHKKELKLERREKLKDKIPKHVKKRKEKLGKERKKK